MTLNAFYRLATNGTTDQYDGTRKLATEVMLLAAWCPFAETFYVDTEGQGTCEVLPEGCAADIMAKLRAIATQCPEQVRTHLAYVLQDAAYTVWATRIRKEP